MKKALLFGLLLSGSAQASDFVTSFTIFGGITGSNFTVLKLDIDVTDRFLAVNGSLSSGNILTESPVSGTCQFNTSNGAFCILQNGFLTFVVDLGANLSGTIRALDGNGNAIQTSAIQIVELR